MAINYSLTKYPILCSLFNYGSIFKFSPILLGILVVLSNGDLIVKKLSIFNELTNC